MGKRKRPQDAEVVQFTQQTASSTKRGTTTVQEKAGNGGILYVQQQQQQQQNEAVVQHQQPQQQQTTTYYQIQQQPVQHVVKQTITVQQPSTDALTFKCIKCEQIFETKSSFLDHCNQFHYFACDLCANCLFDDLVQLNVHMVKHINKFDMCEKCNMVCGSSEELKAHLGNHITTYNREDLVFTSEGQAVLTTGHQQQAATSNGTPVPLSVLNDDSLIEHLASELDQSIGSSMKGKPQKYRCGVCKQDFGDPRLVFKHMNQVHINFPMQQQQQQQQIQAPPSPPPVQQPPPLVPTQQTLTTENVVYTNLSTDNIYYDERTGQYYTIQLMDHSPPLAETPGSQSVIEYVHDSGLDEGTTVEYVTEDAIGETIIVKEEAQKVVITSDGGHHEPPHKAEPPPPLVQITRETDLEELIPTTTLVAADESNPATTLPQQQHHHHHHHHHQSTTTTMPAKQKSAAEIKAAQLVAQQQLTTKCVICSNNFVKKFPKQLYCHTCITKRTA